MKENAKILKKVACLKLSDYNPINYSQVLHVRSIMLINSLSVLLNAKMSLLVFVYITRRVFFLSNNSDLVRDTIYKRYLQNFYLVSGKATRIL